MAAPAAFVETVPPIDASAGTRRFLRLDIQTALCLMNVPFALCLTDAEYQRAVHSLRLDESLLTILADLTDALSRQGVKKLLLLNGHGGNELKPLCRELHHRTDVFLCVCDWFRVCADQYPKLFEKPGEHADEIEQQSEANRRAPGRRRPAVDMVHRIAQLLVERLAVRA